MEKATPSPLSRRLFLGTGAAAVAGAASPAWAVTPPHRSGRTPLRLGLAAYSLRDYLLGQSSPHMTLDDFIDRAAAWGVDAVELTSYYFPPDFTAEYVTSLKRHCFLLGLDVSQTPVGNTFTHPAGPDREKELAHVNRWIDVAADLGSPAIRIFAGEVQPGQSEAEARRNCIETIETCCEHAARRGVFLALENHGGIVAAPDGLLAIVKAVSCEWLGVNLDTGNFETADPYADLVTCAPYAVTVQVKTEVRPSGGPKQEADLERVVRILRDAGYRGYVTLEYEAAEDPLTAVPRHLDRIRALL